MNQIQESASSARLTSAGAGSQAKVRRLAALVLEANAFRAADFLDARLRDGRITSRFTKCVGGVFTVRLVSGDADFEAKGESRDSEEDALAHACQKFASWEFENSIKLGGDAVVLAPCF